MATSEDFHMATDSSIWQWSPRHLARSSLMADPWPGSCCVIWG